MIGKLLLACDLDRTVLPDGPEILTETATEIFTSFVKNPWVILVYLTGRSLKSAQNAIINYTYPFPDVFCCDVGTSIYFNKNNEFALFEPWDKSIKNKWKNVHTNEIIECLKIIPELTLQKEEDQNRFKVSYYIEINSDIDKIKAAIKKNLKKLDIKIEIVTTLNHADKVGYLDILPEKSSKLYALKFIKRHLKIENNHIVYAGDSGNDIETLTSGYKSIVVKNASEKFKEDVKKIALEKNILDKVYFAKGGFRKMNGNYISGILEGLNYFRIYPKVNA